MSEINDIKKLPEGNFPINLKWVHKYQRQEPIIISKYKDGTYHKGYFREVINIDPSRITCKDKIIIT